LSEITAQFRERKPNSKAKKDWIDTEEPQVVLYQGMRGSGKGVAVDQTAEKFYNAGMTVLHIWGARSYENLYWMINKNCGIFYSKLKMIVDGFVESAISDGKLSISQVCQNKGISELDYEEAKELAVKHELIIPTGENKFRISKIGLKFARNELLHCKCHKATPVILVVPHYIKFDMETIDRFNIENSSGYVDPIGIKRMGKPLLVIRHINPPTKADKKEKFVDDFTDIVLQARKQSRVIVMNPAFFEIALEKFATLKEIMNMLPYLMNTSGHFTPLTEKNVGKPKQYWSKKQKSWHKLAVVINEIRSVAPSGKLYGEKEAGQTRRAIMDKIPEMRHFKTWFCSDYQNPEDLDSGLKVQSNYVVVKRSSRGILGDSWKWLFEKIKTDRMNLVRNNLRGFKIERSEDAEKLLRKKGERFRKLRKFVDDRRPLIDELPDNVGYVTSQNLSVKRHSFNLPSFHHKTSLEDFKGDTGIEWSVKLDEEDKEKQIEMDMSKKDKKVAVKKKKDLKNDICKKIHHMRTVDQKQFADIQKELVAMQKEGLIPDMGYEDKKPIYFNILYNRWKDTQ
jgi:hypothetical protein